MSLLSLPNELLSDVAYNLSPSSLSNLLLACRSLYSRLSYQMLQHALAPKDDLPAICWASKNQQTSLLTTIFTHDPPTIPSDITNAAFRMACEYDRLAAAKFLIANGVDPGNGEITLPTAIRKGHLDIVSLLLSHGVSPDIKGYAYEPNTFNLCRNGRIAMLQLLLFAGADVNARNGHRSSCLTLAAQYGHTRCVEVLLAHGADVLVVDGDGDTPLLLAMRYKNYDMVNILLESGCDLNTANGHGLTPLMLACVDGRVEEAAEFLKRGAEMELEGGVLLVDVAMRSGHTMVAELLNREEIKRKGGEILGV